MCVYRRERPIIQQLFGGQRLQAEYLGPGQRQPSTTLGRVDTSFTCRFAVRIIGQYLALPFEPGDRLLPVFFAVTVLRGTYSLAKIGIGRNCPLTQVAENTCAQFTERCLELFHPLAIGRFELPLRVFVRILVILTGLHIGPVNKFFFPVPGGNIDKGKTHLPGKLSGI